MFHLAAYNQTPLTRAKLLRLEFAEVVRTLADEVYPEAETIRLVGDNLNTDTAAAFYGCYPPAEARRLTERIDLCIRQCMAVGSIPSKSSSV